jgi:vanillate O-demethylase ferredoxin subunit
MFKKVFGKQEQSQPANTRWAVVACKKVIADKVIELELRDPDGQDLASRTAGAHLDLHIKKDMLRQYSIANNPSESNRYLVAVLVEEEGTGGSKAVENDINEGDKLLISEPRNHFPLIEDANFSVLIAGGIGLTPLLAMAYRLKGLGKPFKLYYRARSRSWAAYTDLLLNEFGDSVELFFSDEGGRERFKLNELLAGLPQGTQLYTCGANGFMDYVTQTASKYLSEDNIHLEHFYPVPASDPSGDKSFELYCEKSDVTLQVPADKSIVEVLDANGIDIPISCVEGVCGSCITAFTEGEVDHRDCVLSKSEREKSRLFTPCCSRALGDRLAIDL